jgi:hypothetical protein
MQMVHARDAVYDLAPFMRLGSILWASLPGTPVAGALSQPNLYYQASPGCDTPSATQTVKVVRAGNFPEHVSGVCISLPPGALSGGIRDDDTPRVLVMHKHAPLCGEAQTKSRWGKGWRERCELGTEMRKS